VTKPQRDKVFADAAVAAMQGIVSNPATWAELKAEAACNGMDVTTGLANAACNLAAELVAEVGRRTQPRKVTDACNQPHAG
jgi:hypothetical protein